LTETLQEAAAACGENTSVDEQIALVYRDDIARRLLAATRWLEREDPRVSHRLACYEHRALTVLHDGGLDDGVRRCARACSLGSILETSQEDVAKLIATLGSLEQKPENVKRREALEWVSVNVGAAPDHDRCRALGDAVFAVLCAPGGTIVTTNTKDHDPLARALNKSVRRPE